MSKEAICVVIDVGATMGNAAGGAAGQTGLDLAKSAARTLVQQKILFTKQDELALVLLGTDGTDNPCNDDDAEHYHHVTVLSEMGKPTLDLLEKLDSIEVEGRAEVAVDVAAGGLAAAAAAAAAGAANGEEARVSSGDVMDALLVAMKVIENRVGKRKFKRRIFLLTDGGGEVDLDSFSAQEDVIVSALNDSEFTMNVLGVGFSEDADEDEDDDDDVDAGNVTPASAVMRRMLERHPSGVGRRTKWQVATEAMLKQLSKRVRAGVFPIGNALEMLAHFQKRSVLQRPKLKGDLILGDLHIPIATYTKTSRQTLPSLSKFSTKVVDDDDNPEECNAAQGKVKMDRTYWNKQADEETEVDPSDMVRAYEYGKTLVTGVDHDMLKYKSDKALTILGFTKATRIKRHWFMSGVDVVVAQAGDIRGAMHLSALKNACEETGLVAIGRYVKRANARPAVVMLSPYENDGEGFLLNELPFDEDTRQFSFASVPPEMEPNGAQKAAARALVRTLNLDSRPRSAPSQSDDEDDEDSDEEMLDPEFTFNPVLQRFYRSLEARALDRTAEIEDVPAEIKAYIEPDKELLEAAEQEINAFKAAFPLRKVEGKDKGKKRRRHWREYLGEDEPAEMDSAMRALKRGRKSAGEGGASSSSAAAAAAAAGGASSSGAVADEPMNFDSVSAAVNKVGSTDPVSDFNAMIKRRDDPFIVQRAVREMGDMISQLVVKSFRAQLYPKALDCLVALRAGCVIESEADKFNAMLRELKTKFEKKAQFWQMVRDKPILPIDSSECAESTYSPEQARAFFDADALQKGPQVVASAATEDDDFDFLD